MIGWTLGRYFSLRFLRAILGVFFTVFALIYLLDLIEFLRRAGDTPGASTGLIALLSLYRTPSVAEQILPFAVLFGAMTAFLGLSRKLELVVARAAGISVWQFAFPAVMVALGIGVFATTVYNPVSAYLKQRADTIEATSMSRGGGASLKRDLWIRQRSLDGQAILRARAAADGGSTLGGVSVFGFNPDGSFMERVDAAEARLHEGYWELVDARVISPGVEPQTFRNYLVATSLTPDQLRQSFLPAENVPFWQLPDIVQRMDVAGLDSTRYRLQYQALIARPVLLVAMVLVAASVSLRFFRFGGVARLALGGVAAGFVLYVATELVESLGATGVVGPGPAAWLPAVVGTLLGVLALLHQEDG